MGKVILLVKGVDEILAVKQSALRNRKILIHDEHSGTASNVLPPNKPNVVLMVVSELSTH